MINRNAFSLIATLISYLCFSHSVSAINRYFIGDTLYVWADGGLIIRDSSSLKSERIGEIPFGESLIVQEGKYYRHEEEEITIIKKTKDDEGHIFLPVKIQGKWVKIKYKNIEGFVFDGYLSAMPAPGLTTDNNYLTLDDYLDKNFQLLSKKERSADYDNIFTDKLFSEGISIKRIASKSAYAKYLLPPFSLEELLLLLKNSNHINNVTIGLIEDLVIKDHQIRILTFDHEGSGYTTITVANGLIIVEFEAWC